MLRWTYVVLGLGLALGLTTLAFAADEKEKTLKGTICCAKCELKQADKCATVIKVKDMVYYFDPAAHKKYHDDICTAAKEGTVTGTVSKADKKLVITVKDLKYK